MQREITIPELRSPNETDSNMEEANVVDGLFAIARAIDGLSRAVNGAPELMGHELNLSLKNLIDERQPHIYVTTHIEE